jgi:hypothetical protein
VTGPFREIDIQHAQGKLGSSVTEIQMPVDKA